ncbi:MAG: 4-(cytidine 5'-diphospho)-2-C-methyl-D-erythritol kinase [Polymorphobacter sp.]|uniref:4-(cytidine 5'-diphospho)-2-C-methyl-D-erythritol kinase n=1 Tax=Polymorphobacter sp. TaxID=1909290 RepID=UPI003A8A9E34
MLSEHAPAKVNLALHLRRIRADGYHDLETIFAFTAFGDTLHVTLADDLCLETEGDFAAAAGQGGDNLVLRAATALRTAAKVRDGARLRLEKRIPVAAGLGGGSADAAAALRLLNRFWRLDWPSGRLEGLAATLGADVPACVRSEPCLGLGTGEQLAPWPGSVSGTPIVLVNPRVSVPTGPVFQGWDQRDLGGIDPATPLAALRNDMTPAALRIAPVIEAVLAMLADAEGVTLARMSGSGATCFGLFRDAADALAAAEAARRRGWWAMDSQLL